MDHMRLCFKAGGAESGLKKFVSRGENGRKLCEGSVMLGSGGGWGARLGW